MNSPYRINLFHGNMNKTLMEKLSSICEGKRDSEGDFMFTGTLDEFSNMWGHRFLVYPEYNMISVTEYNNFGAR